MNARGGFIPFNRPFLGREEARAAADVIMKGNVSGNGAVGLRVEGKLKSLLGARHALLVTSCTHAMELGFLTLGIGPGDEVLLPSFTFVSTANAVLMVGARPVFVDIRMDDLTIDPDKVKGAISPRTRAMVLVHYAGVSCQMDSLLEIARNSGIYVIEDAAHAIGATWRGAQLGSIGDIGCISFHGTKNIVCGEGGAFITNDEKTARVAEVIREKGTNRSAFLRGEVERYTWISKGSSYVLSEIMAAILAVQLDKMSWITSEREKIWRRYSEGLANLAERGLIRLCKIPEGAGPNWHIFYFLTETSVVRNELIKYLRALGIETTFHFIPLHSSPFVTEQLGMAGIELPVTEYVSSRLIRLPIYPGLSVVDQERVIDGICSYYRHNGSKRKRTHTAAEHRSRHGV